MKFNPKLKFLLDIILSPEFLYDNQVTALYVSPEAYDLLLEWGNSVAGSVRFTKITHLYGKPIYVREDEGIRVEVTYPFCDKIYEFS